MFSIICSETMMFGLILSFMINCEGDVVFPSLVKEKIVFGLIVVNHVL